MTMKTISLAGIAPAFKAAPSPTLVVPPGQRGVITNVHGSSATGGAASLNLGPTAGTVTLGSIAAGGRLDVELGESVAIGDPDFDIVLNIPADFVGSMLGYYASGQT